MEIFNYVTEGTLDSYLYQIVTDKARFIAQLLDGQSPARVMEDCDERVLTTVELQAAVHCRCFYFGKKFSYQIPEIFSRNTTQFLGVR